MTTYDFRLKFYFSESYRIDSPAEELELLALQSGERVRLRSAVTGTPINDQAGAIVLGGPFSSEDDARAAAERSKHALLCWAIKHRVGIDLGGERPLSVVTNAGLARYEELHGCPFRNEIHGIDVYEHVENLRFVALEVKGKLSKDSATLIDAFNREYLTGRSLTEKQVVAGELYANSFFDVSPRSRFITLVTAIEALLEPLERSNEVQSLVEELKGTARRSPIDKPTMDSVVGSLERLRHESIGEAGRAMALRLVPDEVFDGQSAPEFFRHCYNLRSRILHDGSIADGSVDTRKLANAMETFVARLLLASLNDGAQEGVADDGAER